MQKRESFTFSSWWWVVMTNVTIEQLRKLLQLQLINTHIFYILCFCWPPLLQDTRAATTFNLQCKREIKLHIFFLVMSYNDNQNLATLKTYQILLETNAVLFKLNTQITYKLWKFRITVNIFLCGWIWRVQGIFILERNVIKIIYLLPILAIIKKDRV